MSTTVFDRLFINVDDRRSVVNVFCWHGGLFDLWVEVDPSVCDVFFELGEQCLLWLFLSHRVAVFVLEGRFRVHEDLLHSRCDDER